MTAAFLSALQMEQIGPRRWLLIADLAFQSLELSGTFVVSRGFQSDLASTPRIAWLLFPPSDVYNSAAVLHDAAYAGALMTLDGRRIWLIKPWADRLFHEALRASGVNAARAQVMYLAVKFAGDPSQHPLAAHANAV